MARSATINGIKYTIRSNEYDYYIEIENKWGEKDIYNYYPDKEQAGIALSLLMIALEYS